jgi:hypothetical protein
VTVTVGHAPLQVARLSKRAPPPLSPRSRLVTPGHAYPTHCVCVGMCVTQLRAYASPPRNWIKLVSNAIVNGATNVTMQLRPPLRTTALSVLATKAVFVNGFQSYVERKQAWAGGRECSLRIVPSHCAHSMRWCMGVW